jgi:hypothetical protein
LLCSNPSPLAILLHSPVEFSHHSSSEKYSPNMKSRYDQILCKSVVCSRSIISPTNWWTSCIAMLNWLRMYTAKGCVYIKVCIHKYPNQPTRDHSGNIEHDRQSRSQ